MVGGTVIETIDCGPATGEFPTGRVWINCKSIHSSSTCAIYVERDDRSRSVSVGDDIWWQGGMAFWTPKGAPFSDMVLMRLGFSGVTRPQLSGV